MDYYIQGDAANADRIKAAFKELGIVSNVDGYNYKNDNVLYFTAGGMIHMIDAYGSWANIIKTHPDYKELELPVEPKFKFKVGDWIVQNDNGTVSQITKTINGKDEYGEYRAYEHTNGYFAACFENEYHLWTIQDAKEGDVLVDTLSGTRALTILFSFINADDSISAYCGWNGYTFRVTIDGLGYGTLSSTQYVPATKEQRDMLFAKMREAGYQWDADKKELRKIKPHYDIANFRAGMPVLVRADNNCRWDYSVFSRITGNESWQFAVCNGVSFTQCIPFEGNEHLLGTTDMPSEEYINW